MKERGILMSAPMVRASLDGTKTQTRRALRDQNPVDLGAFEHGGHLSRRPLFDKVAKAVVGHRMVPVHCPYGVPGDRLWVREAWAQRLDLDHLNGTQLFEAGVRQAWYWADGPGKCCNTGCAGAAGRVRAARFMPRWASRITLELLSVKVERLGAITEADARAEGVLYVPGHGNITPADLRSDPGYSNYLDCRAGYAELWASINGSYDPATWVWVLEFKRITP